MTTPDFGDPALPQRLRAQAVIREGEERIGRSWFRSLTHFLDRLRPAVTRNGGVDPAAVGREQGFWTREVDAEVRPTVAGVLAGAWRRVTGAGEPATDPWVSGYLNEVGNRLVRLPDEVYGLIVAEVERGIREGRSLDRVMEDVQRVLTSTGSEYWPNRARVVARTETMGAVNAGVFRAAQLEAAERGDAEPGKVWIATDDRRTRPTHVKADGQRVPLAEPFRVGGSALMFPGDPRGPAQEVIQCRCSLLPVVLGETIDWTDRQRPRGGS